MLFSEIYNAYFKAMAELLTSALDESLDTAKAMEIINHCAFRESFTVILDAIRNEEWLLMNRQYQTPLHNIPSQPFSLLQLRFLKTITLDPRLSLFGNIIDLPEDIEPLYTADDIYYFDQIKDGDPYKSEEYRRHFQEIHHALKHQKMLSVIYQGKAKRRHINVHPSKLEYSLKDDKFRLIAYWEGRSIILNLARIVECSELSDNCISSLPKMKKASVTVEIIDVRNALERAMLHFANYEKETRQISDTVYHMKCSYNKSDETEVLIRILSFGPMLRVLEPASFVKQINERLLRQAKLIKDYELIENHD